MASSRLSIGERQEISMSQEISMETLGDTFTEFFERSEPKLRNALVASYGVEVGTEAASDALAYGWEHWDRVREMDNPVGYLFRVGRSRSRRFRRRPPLPIVAARPNPIPWVEPGLPKALARLSERQRVAVILVHSLGWTYAEAAELLGVSIGTVEIHVRRGLRRLRRSLGVRT
jgi:DNA-directed RNA polymerase specialized sigma24 family protein